MYDELSKLRFWCVLCHRWFVGLTAAVEHECRRCPPAAATRLAGELQKA